TKAFPHQHYVGDSNLIGANLCHDFSTRGGVYGGGRATRRVENDETHSHQNGKTQDDDVASSFEASKLFEHLFPFQQIADCSGTTPAVATTHPRFRRESYCPLSIVCGPLSVGRCATWWNY